MPRMTFINLPFASIRRPAIGLTQLKARLANTIGSQLRTSIIYLNIDCSLYIGVDLYNAIAESMDHHSTGLGDWFFRSVAFPTQPDNSQAYFARFYPQKQSESFRKIIAEKRSGLETLFESLIDRYEIHRSDIVGLSSTFSQNVACIAMARLLKRRRSDIVILMGGSNCESVMGEELARNEEVIDFVFSGPALVSLPKFIANYLEGRISENCNIPGVLFQKKGAKLLRVVGSCANGEECDINTPLFLDYTDYIAKLVSSALDRSIQPTLLFETSRGCWWGEKAHCTFCGLNGENMNYRSMTADNAITLIKSLFRYSSMCSHFESVDNILPRHYVRDVFSHVSAPEGTDIFYEVKADLSEDDLAILSRAGVRRLQPGIESFDTSTLKLMRKGTTGAQNVQFLRNCLTSQVWPYWNLLIGFPGESPNVFRKYYSDLRLLFHLPPPMGVFPVRFDRFSPYFRNSTDFKLDLQPMSHYSFTYPYDEHSLKNLAYYFYNQNVESDYFAAMTEWQEVISNIVEQWRRRWRKHLGKERLVPELYFVRGAPREVFDSRSGQTERHELSDVGRKLLDSLYEPKTVETIAQEPELRGIGGIQLEIEALRSRGLLFEDDKRLVSLVCRSEPSTEWLNQREP